MSRVDPRTPVLVGVGRDDAGGEVADLMTAALRRAGRDAGAERLLGMIDRIVVPQGTWTHADPGREAAIRVGSPGAASWRGAVGISQQALVTGALQAIAGGDCQVVAVVGGEDRAHQAEARRRPAGAAPPDGAASRPAPPPADREPADREPAEREPADREPAEREPAERELAEREPAGQLPVGPDLVLEREPDFVHPAEVAAGLVQPVAQYAMIELALGHAEGTAPERHRLDVAELWARFSQVAAAAGTAAFASPKQADEIACPSPANRPLAFPYNKWHASQWTVDQAAALLLCSAGAARRSGVPPDRWIFPLVSLDASAAISLSQRRALHRWPAMALLGRQAAERIGRPLSEVELLEVYSCFPAAVRVQQRELGLPLDGTPTRCGGMTFAGGPFNNFTYQATERMVHQLRERPEQLGALTTVCGLLTKPGLAVWAAAPDGRPPRCGDLAEEARRQTPAAEVAVDYRGPATVATYTVAPEAGPPADHGAGGGRDPAAGYRGRPLRTMVVADLADGRRAVAASTDAAVGLEAVCRGLIGQTVHLDGAGFVP